MFKEIVVGVDEHDASQDAIALAKSLAAPDAKFTLVHVYPEDDQPSPQDAARKLVERVAQQAGLDDVSILATASPSPGKGIARVAENAGADLIVLGSRDSNAEAPADLNDSTRAALDGAPCAVAIAPAKYGAGPREINAIGVGYDGRSESRHALEFTKQLAKELNASLFAIEVIDFTEYETAQTFSFSTYELEKPLLSAIRDEITAMPGVEGLIKVGFTEVKLTECSSTVDLLVLGSRGYGPLGRLVHGSTTLQMAHNSHCPLLLLTRATRPNTAAAPALPVDAPGSVAGVATPA